MPQVPRQLRLECSGIALRYIGEIAEHGTRRRQFTAYVLTGLTQQYSQADGRNQAKKQRDQQADTPEC